jgi:hypothetical protein
MKRRKDKNLIEIEKEREIKKKIYAFANYINPLRAFPMKEINDTFI